MKLRTIIRLDIIFFENFENLRYLIFFGSLKYQYEVDT